MSVDNDRCNQVSRRVAQFSPDANDNPNQQRILGRVPQFAECLIGQLERVSGEEEERVNQDEGKIPVVYGLQIFEGGMVFRTNEHIPFAVFEAGYSPWKMEDVIVLDD